MRMFAIIVAVLLHLLAFSHADAQTQTGPRFRAEFRPVVGGWSEYQVTSKTDPPSKLKAAIVGKEGDAFWYELVVESKGSKPMITKMLVTGNPEDSKNIRRAIMKAGDDPAMELPTHMIHASDARETQMKVIDRGSETVKVPAGTFATRHLHYPYDRTDAWVHKDVVPYGVIKLRTTDAEWFSSATVRGPRA